MRRRGAYMLSALQLNAAVRLYIDPKHRGVVIAIFGTTVRVLWDDTNFKSDHNQEELYHAD